VVDDLLLHLEVVDEDDEIRQQDQILKILQQVELDEMVLVILYLVQLLLMQVEVEVDDE